MSISQEREIKNNPGYALLLIEKLKTKLEDSEAKHKQEIEELKSEYQNVIDANKEGHEEAVEQAREETRQQCAKAYKLYVKETLPSDWDDHDAEQAIRNSGKQDKGEGE